MNICFVSPNGQPNGPRARVHNYAKRLVERYSYNVTIITKSYFHASDYNYLDKSESYKCETIDGVNVVWINGINYGSSSFLRLINEFQFAFRFFLLRNKILNQTDIFVADSVTPINSLFSLIVAKIFDALFIHQIRDVWPIALVKDGSLSRFNPSYFIFRSIEKFTYKHSDWICSALPAVHRHIEKSGGDSEKITYIRNGADLTIYKDQPEYSGISDHFNLTYVGTISNAHDVITLIRSAELLLIKGYLNFSIHIYGDGVKREECISEVNRLRLDNVFFYGMVSKSTVPDILSKSDLLLAPVLDSDAYEFGINLNKLYDYMASGRPILFSGRAPNDDIKAASCGFSIPPEAPEIMCAAIESFFNMSSIERKKLGANAKRFAFDNYDVDKLVVKFNEMLIHVKNLK